VPTGRFVGRSEYRQPAVSKGDRWAPGVGPLVAGEDPHGLRPAVQLVSSGSLTQQPGQVSGTGCLHEFDGAGVRNEVLGVAYTNHSASSHSAFADY
jgi:hypothetical protein